MKVITKAKVAEQPVYLELLKNELDCLEQLDHPNIVKTLELLEDEECIYVVMELC